MRIKIAIIDDHPMLIRGLKGMLLCHPGFKITGTYLGADDFLRSLNTIIPDVILMDIVMPGKTGEELAEQLCKQYPELKIIAFTNLEHQYYIKSMLKSGVKGYVIKSSDESVIIQAIETVFSGKSYYDPAIAGQVIQALRKTIHEGPQNPILSDREKEILELIATDYSSQEISKKLFISKRTVDFHRMNLLLKLDVKNAMGLVRRALELGIIK